MDELPNLCIRSRGTVSGLSATIVHHLGADGRLRQRIDSRDPSDAVFDGQKGWAIDATGLLSPLELEDLEIWRMVAAIRFGQRSWITQDNGVWRVIGGRYPFHFDGTTLRAVGGPTTWHFTDWRDGMAYGLRTHAGWLEDTDVIEAVEPEDWPSDELPAVSRISRNAEYIAMGRTRRGHLPTVRPVINGVQMGAFLLDTGASRVAFDASVADRLGLPSFGRTWVATSDGGRGCALRSCHEFSLGPVHVESLSMLDIDTDDLGLGTKLDGIVGFDVFGRCTMTWSEAGLRLSSEEAPEGVPVCIENRTPLIECQTSHGSVLVALDTGSSAGLLLYPSAVHRLGLKPQRVTKSGRGLTGRQSFSTKRLPWLSVGETRFEDIEALLAIERSGVGSSLGKDGTLGWGLLKKTDFVLDVPRTRFSLRRRGEP